MQEKGKRRRASVLLFVMSACLLGLGVPAAQASLSDVPTPTITGPLPDNAISHPFASLLPADKADLTAHGYEEKEYLISGEAFKYTTPALPAPPGDPNTATGVKVLDGPNVDGSYPYTTRILVRRPISAADFNGALIVDWENVTAGYDLETTWRGQSPDEIMDDGYAWIGASVQTVGVNFLKTWPQDPTRYASLDTTGGGHVTPTDALSYDIYSQVAKAARGFLNGRDPMDGLEPSTILAEGGSQSGGRLRSYYNSIQPVAQAYDGFIIEVATGSLRPDLAAKVIRVLSQRESAIQQPDVDTSNYRLWEVAGASHVPKPIQDAWGAFLARDVPGQAPFTCAKQPLSEVPLGDVVQKAEDAIVAWINGGPAPAMSPRMSYASPNTYLFNALGQAEGGIRLATILDPVALNDNVNTFAPGTTDPFSLGFCTLLGSNTPFSATLLGALYSDYGDYVHKFNTASAGLVSQGFLSPTSAQREDDAAALFPDLRPTKPSVATGGHTSVGQFTLTWLGTKAPGTTFELQHRNGSGADWTDVPGAAALTTPSFTFTAGSPEAEGTWSYRVRSKTDTPAQQYRPEDNEITPFSDQLDGVAVDHSGPPAPLVIADRMPEFAGNGGWFKDTVTVSFTGLLDPPLADGTPGSGLDPATVPGPQTFTTSGAHTVSGMTKDRAGNSSASASLTVQVDSDAPMVSVMCPTGVFVGDVVNAVATASDGQSGLAMDPSGNVAVDTSSPGTKTTTVTAVDNVGHSASASCMTLVHALPMGTPGPAGKDGKDGIDGKDGKDGAVGPAGPAGPKGPEGRSRS